MPEIQVKDKLTTAEEVKAAYDALDGSKLENNFSTYTAATLPYANTEKIALRGTDGNNYYTTIGELASQIGGGGGGTTQAALVHYVKNCGSISGSGTTLNWTNPQIDNNITENMVVLKAELSNPAAQTSDWTCTTTNGYVTISGTIASGSSTNVLLYFGVSLSTAPSIIVNLASNSSDNVLKTNPTPGVMGVLGVANGGTGADTAAGALTALGAVPKTDLTSIIATGTTNATGATIAKGTYFYLNGALVQAKADIASGATFTSGTNYNAVTAGGLNSLQSNITLEFISYNNTGFHNSIYRGKYLGTSVTAAQYAAISAGTFDDLFIGDYWTINGVNWRIAALDYWLNHGDTSCTTHHVVIVPDSNLASCKMNDTNITTGAYIGSDYYTGANSNTGKATAQSAINSAFGSAHILNHREYLQNATTNGYESAGTWYDSTFELMTERMVYGCDIFHNVQHGTNIPNFYSIDTSQLPLFRHDHSRICNRAYWWLRDVASAALFAVVTGSGLASSADASASLGVRPAFGIKG